MCVMHKLKDEIPSFPLTFDDVGFNSRFGLFFVEMWGDNPMHLSHFRSIVVVGRKGNPEIDDPYSAELRNVFIAPSRVS